MTKINIPDNIKFLMQTLIDQDYQVFVVGGAIRDSILGQVPKDWDLFTNCQDLLEVFPDGKVLGGEERQEKILTVVVDDVEVSTFRINGDRTQTGGSLEQHQETCDFTINSIACDINGSIIDSFGGMQDINTKRLQFVGSPLARISEDPLRLLRGIRFLTKYGLQTDPGTFEFFKNSWAYVRDLPKERLRDEFLKIIQTDTGLGLMIELDIIGCMIPGYMACVGVQGGSHHNETVDEHMYNAFTTAKTISNDWRIWLAAFLHDLGKGRTFTREFPEDYIGEPDEGMKSEVHFYQHEKVGADMVEEWMREYKFAEADIKFVSKLVYMHMWGFKEGFVKKTFIKKLDKLQDAGCSIYDFLMICYCDHQGNMAKPRIKYGDFMRSSFLMQNYFIAIKDNVPFKTTDLEISGQDVIKHTQYRNKYIGICLNEILDLVQEGELPNKRNELMFYLKNNYKQEEPK